APVVTVSSRTEADDGTENHVCRVDGFYPKEIDASWRRDGEVWLQDNFHGSVAPNADGTYHYWLSIRIDPQERDRYRCHVEHDGLQEPVAMKERPSQGPPRQPWGVCEARGFPHPGLPSWQLKAPNAKAETVSVLPLPGQVTVGIHSFLLLQGTDQSYKRGTK
ncbi:major histocompatibility complex class I-related gene protein-like, partial [Python bivittatus]|uniref:Major histocompatibility complex class I-related gene protein-like n=1 Tax=Python bivittatus TaxID=176946 RepID=A0A9F2RE50_PYTBI